MVEISAPWNGTTVGDASIAPYDAPTEWAKIQNSLGGGGGSPNLGIVFRGELNELAVTGTATPVSVDTGRAICWGTWYENGAAVTVAIPTPAVSTRIDRIVLRKSWSAQTVRITRIAGAEGGGVPAMTQSAGITWDIPLAQVSITTGGVITVTDERTFDAGNYQVFTANGTWTKPDAAGFIVELVGAGGGGGGGKGDLPGTVRAGGGGGGGGSIVRMVFPSSALAATVAITIGAGGAGGAGGSTADGSNGSAGGNSTFGTHLTAYGGGGGGGGDNTIGGGGGGGGTGGAGLQGIPGSGVLGGNPRISGATIPYDGIGGMGGSSNGNAEYGGGGGGSGADGGSSIYSGGGGGSGGGVDAANAEIAGFHGGANDSFTPGGGGLGGGINGGPGFAGATRAIRAGNGGGGGGGQASGVGGVGGAGGAAGAGGGGGGGASTIGGAGGAGSRGEVRIYAF